MSERGPFSTQAVANQRGNTRGQHSFAQIPRAEIQRSVFNRSCGLKTAFDGGALVPIFVDEALPGDSMTLRCSSMVRMATPLFPVMDNMYLDFFFFSVPYRLVWENWQRMMGEQDNPTDSTDFLVPIFDGTGSTVVEGSLSDYMGLPLGAMVYAATDTGVVSVFHRAYNKIWNEWFRDQNLQDSVTVNMDDGPDSLSDTVLMFRNKQHDYFTSCLPFAQKGDPVSLPLGTTAPVIGDGSAPTWTDGVDVMGIRGIAALNTVRWSAVGMSDAADATWSAPHLVANLAGATAATINDIREAFQIQRLLERDARGGTRYTEIIRAHFGVVSPDARMQRPEYIGGGSTRINVHPVARTTTNAAVGSGNNGPPIAELGAFATANAHGVGFSKSFTEHCMIIGIANVRADITYQQGTNKMFTRRSRFEFYWPALAHLGEQSVSKYEIYTQGGPEDLEVFGFQERYAEYRYKPSTTSSAMRSTSALPLDGWHLGLEFITDPELNNTFIRDLMPYDRILAVGVSANGKQFFGDFYFDYRCARPMPTYGVPGFIDHF